ncbi:hypothetical protein BC940DRAFT_237031, partial [Gongronella butleri]
LTLDLVGTLHKRIPQRAATTPTDIYFSTKSKSKVLVQRIKRLMVDEKHARVTLHGMGAVILPAINTAQAAKEAMHHHVDLKFTTSTVHLIDDIEPDDMVTHPRKTKTMTQCSFLFFL